MEANSGWSCWCAPVGALAVADPATAVVLLGLVAAAAGETGGVPLAGVRVAPAGDRAGPATAVVTVDAIGSVPASSMGTAQRVS